MTLCCFTIKRHTVAASAYSSKSSDDFTLLLYPNPVGEELQVYFSGPAGGERHFRILDAQGREWRRFPPAFQLRRT